MHYRLPYFLRIFIILITFTGILPTAMLIYDYLIIPNNPFIFQATHLVYQAGKNTFAISMAVSCLATGWGIIAGFIFFKINFKGKKIFFIFMLSGLAIPMHVHCSTWILLMGRNGILTSWLKVFAPHFNLYGSLGVIWISSIAYAPLATLLCGLSFYNVNFALEEQSALYLSHIKRIAWVILPQARWGIIIAFLVIFGLSIGEIAVADILGVDTLARKIYLLVSLYYKPEAAILFILPLVLASVFFCAMLFTIIGKTKIAILSGHRRACSFQSRKFFLLFFILIPCMPYLASIPALLYATNGPAKIYSTYLATKIEIMHTLQICFLSACLSTVISLISSWIIIRKYFGYYLLIFLAFWLTLMPASLTGIGILRSIAKGADFPLVSPILLSIRDSSIFLAMAMCFRYFPHGLVVCLISLSFLPVQVEEIAAMYGNNLYQQLHKVILPATKKNIILCFLVIFSFCLGDLDLSVLVIPPGPTTLTIRTFTLMHYGVRSDVACCSLFILLLLFLTTLAGYFLLLQKK